jgi:peroxiredoxin
VLYGTTGVPETFIIDKDGIIREKIVGPRVWDSDDNISMIEKWL